MDIKLVGEQIATLRKQNQLTQNDLGERLGVSFQAVSKWERGETLPDTALLVDLAKILDTTVDFILSGGRPALTFRGKISVSDCIEGLRCLEKMGVLLGRDHMIYRHAIRGINEGMNVDIEEGFRDDYIFEAFVAEAILQNLMAGAYVDVTDVRTHFKHEHFRNIVLKACEKYGIR